MRLGELLRQKGLLTAAKLEIALHGQSRFGGRLGTNLIHLGYVAMDAVALALSDQYKLPPVLREHVATVDKKTLGLFPARLVLAHKAVPIGYTPTRYVAVDLAAREASESSAMELAPPAPKAPPAPPPAPPTAKSSPKPKAGARKSGRPGRRDLSPPPPPAPVARATGPRTLEMPEMPAPASLAAIEPRAPTPARTAPARPDLRGPEFVFGALHAAEPEPEPEPEAAPDAGACWAESAAGSDDD